MERIILAILHVVVKFQHVTEVSPSCLWHANAHSPSQPSSHWSSHPQGGSRELVASLCYRWGNEIPEQGHGFSKAMQLISNGARSRSQASWLPTPYVFNSRDRLRKKPVQILACPIHGAGGQVNLSLTQWSQPLWWTSFLFCLHSVSAYLLTVCVLSTGHPRGQQAHRGHWGGRCAQIPSPPVQGGPGQGTSVFTGSLWDRQWELSTSSVPRDMQAGGKARHQQQALNKRLLNSWMPMSKVQHKSEEGVTTLPGQEEVTFESSHEHQIGISPSDKECPLGHKWSSHFIPSGHWQIHAK